MHGNFCVAKTDRTKKNKSRFLTTRITEVFKNYNIEATIKLSSPFCFITPSKRVHAQNL